MKPSNGQRCAGGSWAVRLHGSMEALVRCWHAPYWEPARKAAIWPARAGFEPFPLGAPGRLLLIPLILTWATGPSHSAGPLVGSGQKVLEPTTCFLSHGHEVLVLGTTNRIPVGGASGIKGRFWVDRPCLRNCGGQAIWGTSCPASVYTNPHM